MAKLYPPYIEGQLPAQSSDAEISIPFQMNRAVSLSEVSAICIKIKTVMTDSLVATVHEVPNFDTSLVVCDLSSKLQPGQFYKVQLAYVNHEGEIGYYSTVGIMKFIGSNPELRIEGLVNNQTNQARISYAGVYNAPSTDPTEKEYSYKFEILKDNKIIYSTDYLIHKSDSEVDIFEPSVFLTTNEIYILKYSTITINGLESSVEYAIAEQEDQDLIVPGTLTAVNNFEDGYISISLTFDSDQTQNRRYRLLRFAKGQCDVIGEFNTPCGQSGSKIRLHRDYSVEQGVEYQYAIQPIVGQIYGKKAFADTKMADFEDIFLYDGERQLKLRFDPKISSFKTSILETKIDSLGGQFPMFFRNGHVGYKEFPISALISMLSDENELFFAWQTTLPDRRTSTPQKNPVIANSTFGATMKQERDFKLEVLNWLGNGQPKLFRSAAEGNYVVRLMNISMSPNDTLGRMLHTVTAQAYEVANNDYRTLVNKELVTILDPVDDAVLLLDKDQCILLADYGDGIEIPLIVEKD